MPAAGSPCCVMSGAECMLMAAHLHAQQERHWRLQQVQHALVRWQHRHEHALPGEGPQQRDHGQDGCGEQADAWGEEHQLPLKQGTCGSCRSAGISQPLARAWLAVKPDAVRYIQVTHSPAQFHSNVTRSARQGAQVSTVMMFSRDRMPARVATVHAHRESDASASASATAVRCTRALSTWADSLAPSRV